MSSSADPNHYRYYICNLQSPKMKARELRITKSAEITGGLDLQSSDMITTGSITSGTTTTSQLTVTSGPTSIQGALDVTTGPTSIQGALTVTDGLVSISPNTTVNDGWGDAELRLYDRDPESGTSRTYLQIKQDSLIPPEGEIHINTVTEGMTGIDYPIKVEMQNVEVAKFAKTANSMSNPLNLYPPTGTDKGSSFLRLLCRDQYNNDNAGGIQLASSYVGPTYENAVSISGYKKGASEYPTFYILNGGTDAIVIDKVGNVNVPTTLTVDTATYTSWLIPNTIGCDVTIEFIATGVEANTNAPVFSVIGSGLAVLLSVNNFIPAFLTGGFKREWDTTVNDDKSKFFAPISGTYQISVSARCVDNTTLGVGFLGDRAYGGSNIYAALPYSGVVPFTRDDAQRSMMAVTFNLQLVQNQRFSVWQAITQTGNRWLWCKMNIRLINQA